jgi:hypothetical protein
MCKTLGSISSTKKGKEKKGEKESGREGRRMKKSIDGPAGSGVAQW